MAEVPGAPPKAGKRKLSRAGIAALCAALVLVAAVTGGAQFINSKLKKIQYSDGRPAQTYAPDLEEEDIEDTVDISGLEQVESSAIPEIDMVLNDGVFNILLLGTDDRSLEFSDNARADSIMLLSLNFDEKTGKLVSFERGVGVPILGGVYEGKHDWLTHCFRYGGSELMLKEIQECFKVDVDYYMRVNLNALIKVIDVLGGVDVELTATEAWYLNESGGGGYWGEGTSRPQTDLQPGINHLGGITALAYARLRAIDSDWHRIERQRAVIQGCADALKSANLATLNTLCNELLPLVQTNLTQKEILGLMFKVPGMLGLTLDQLTIPEEGHYGGMSSDLKEGRGMFWPDWEYNIQLLQTFLYGEEAVA